MGRKGQVGHPLWSFRSDGRAVTEDGGKGWPIGSSGRRIAAFAVVDFLITGAMGVLLAALIFASIVFP